MNSRRIDLLDSFRFLAILSVLLYHFTIEWKDQTPYGNYFGSLFKYGYLGVEFFFVISDFFHLSWPAR
jgi:peptidoglycan/LPS O-acetylase OafA/YrhL